MKMFQHSKGVWLGLAVMGFAIASHAVEVLTLGGGPTEASPSRAGLADGSTLLSAKFKQPFAVAVLPNGNLVIADRGNNKLRLVSQPGNDADSITTTFGPRIKKPTGVAVHPSGLIFSVGEKEHSVQMFNVNGELLSTFGGFNSPTAIAVDRLTNVYVTELRGRVLKLTMDGTITEITSGFNQPRGIALLRNGQLVVSESRGHAIYQVNPDTGSFTLLSGGNGPGFADGAAGVAKFNNPHGIAVAPNGVLVVADKLNHRIRLVNTNGTVSTLYGQSKSAFFRPFKGWRDGSGADDDGPGDAMGRDPVGITVASNGTVYVTETHWNIVRQVTGAGHLLGDDTTTPGGGANVHIVTTATSPTNIAVITGAGTYNNGDDATFIAPASFTNEQSIIFTFREFRLNGAPASNNPFFVRTFTGNDPANIEVVAVYDLSVPEPTFSPSFGYFPMGVTVTVTSPVPVFYTTDGTEPTTNSRQVQLLNNVGTFRFTEHLRDLTSLRLRAFVGTNASEIVSGLSSPVNEIGIPTDIVAGSGSTIVVPVVVNLRTNDEIRSIQFRLEVEPLNGGPPILSQFRAISVTSNDFISVAAASKPNTVATYLAQQYSTGPTRRGILVRALGTDSNFEIKRFAVAAMVAVPISPSAFAGHNYRMEVVFPSATSDAGQADMPIQPMAPKIITIGSRPYLVGDSSPGSWYTAGDFGDGDLRNSDVNNVFYAHQGVRAPYPFTDVFNAMDAYPPEETGLAGNGELDFFDFNLILNRALRFNPNNWVRRLADGGVIESEPAGLPAPPPPAAAPKSVETPPGPGTVWLREVTVGAGSLRNVQPGAVCEVPVWIKAAPGYSVGGLSLRMAVMPDGDAPAVGTVTFTPVLGVDNFMSANGVAPNEALCTWLMVPSSAFPTPLQGSNVLGRLRFVIPPGATPGQSYSVRFLKMSGGADMSTPYQFESLRNSVWVQSEPLLPAEVTSVEWKEHFFGDASAPAAESGVDADEDGIPNGQEYFEGTSPIDPASRLTLVQNNIQRSETNWEVQLSWLSASGKLYVIDRGPTPTGPWTTLEAGIPGDGYEKQRVDFVTSEAAPFYRIRVQP